MKKISKLDINYIALFASMFFGNCCLGAYLSAYLLDLGFTNTLIGTTLAIGSILSIVVQPVVASIADKLQKMSLRTLLAILYSISCVLVAIIWVVPFAFPKHAIIPTAVLFVILNSIAGAEGALVTSLGMEHNYGGNGINFSLARGCGSFAYAISCLIVGFLVDDFGSVFLVPANLGFKIITLILVATFPKPTKVLSESGVDTAKEDSENASSLLAFARENARFLLVVLSFVLVYSVTAVLNNFSIQLIDHVGGSESKVGIATSIAAFTELPAMALFPIILKRVGSVSNIMKFAAVMMIIKSFITAFAPSVEWIYVSQLFQCVSFALLLPCSVYYVNRFVPRKDKVKGQSFMNMTLSIASIVVTLFGGKIIDTLGIGVLVKIAAFLCLAGAVMMFVFAHKDNTPPEKRRLNTIFKSS